MALTDIYVGKISSLEFYLTLHKMHSMFGIDNENYNAENCIEHN